MTAAPPAPRYFFNTHRQAVQGIFRDAAGKRVFRRLASFAEAGLDATGAPLPGMSEAARDALLGPRWRTAQEALAAEGARVEAMGTIGDLWAKFIKAAASDRAPGTLALYRTARWDYLAANGDHPLVHFSLHHVDGLKTRATRAAPGSGKRLAPHTVNQRLNALRAFLRWAYDRDELAKLPKFPNVPAPRKRPTVLPPAELQALIGRISRLAHNGHPAQRADYRRHLRFLMVGLGCGLRRGEILNLRWEHVNLDRGVVTVRITRQFRTKEHREKVVPMPAFLRRFLDLEKRAKPKAEVWLLDSGTGHQAYPGKHGAHSITNAFRRHLAAIGAVRGVKPTHGQRALFATELHRRGADAYTIQQLMGHSTIAVTEHYLADPDSAKRRAVDTLSLPRMPRSAGKTVSGAVSRSGKALK